MRPRRLLLQRRVPVEDDRDGWRGRLLDGHVHQKAPVGGDRILRLRHDTRRCSRRWRAASGRAAPARPPPASARPLRPRSAPPSNGRQARHKTVPSRRAATAAGSRPPSTPATGRRALETVGRKSALSWIRSTDTPPTARRGRIAPPSRRRASARPGTACGRRPAAGPRGPTLSSDPGCRRAGHCPSGDQASGVLSSPVTSSGCSSPAPLAAFSKQVPRAVAQGP